MQSKDRLPVHFILFILLTLLALASAAQAGETALISSNAGETDSGNSYSFLDSFRDRPGHDRYVAFGSAATDLTGDPDPSGSGGVFWHDTMTDTTELVSWNVSNTAAADGTSDNQLVSADGRYVVFQSNAVDIHPLVSGGVDAILLRDRQTDSTSLVTVNAAGTAEPNDSSDLIGISPDGRFVLFASYATDLVSLPDSNSDSDLFVRDLVTETTTLVSVNQAGTATGDQRSTTQAVLARGGRYVVFNSDATDLVAGDTNGFTDVFVRDLELGVTSLVSVNVGGTASGNWDSQIWNITSDGRWVIFSSTATDLTNDPDGGHSGTEQNVFLRDLETGTTELVSIARDGASGNFDSGKAGVSEDGRFVVFVSSATNLLPEDTLFGNKIFVRDMQTATTELVSISADGTTSGNGTSNTFEMSDNGRFVAFSSLATDLVSVPDNNGSRDGFLRDLLSGNTELLTINGAGTETAADSVNGLHLSTDGRFATFHTDASDLGPTDTNTKSDVYRREHDLAETVDFGDAPPPYPVVFGDDGASHLLGGLFLGASIDGEPDGAPSALAKGDDGAGANDEDGVDLPDQFLPGVVVDLDVTASAAGLLNAWVDFNRDGDWDDAGEQIFVDEPLLAGSNSLQFTPPATAEPGVTYARFRFDSGGGLTPTGHASDGEVEDYVIANTRDIFADGFESGDTSAWSATVP